MMMNSTTETSVRRAETKGQPVSRLYFPPPMTSANAIKLARHRMMVNEAMKPTVRHMEQKYRSPYWQSSLDGKSRQCGSSRLEQLLCRPMCFSSVSPEVVVTEYDTQWGSVMEATIMAVAMPAQLVPLPFSLRLAIHRSLKLACGGSNCNYSAGAHID